MKLFNIVVYRGDPWLGAHPFSDRNVVAESGSQASKMAMDDLGRFPWKQIDALEVGDASSETRAKFLENRWHANVSH